MLPLLVIPILSQATEAAASGSSFFDQPIDEILFDLLVWFGWIPIVMTLIWGFLGMWLNYRRGIYSSSRKYMLLAIDVPSMTEQSPKALENFFAALYATKSAITWKEKWIDGRLHPVFSFEIVSTEGYIQFIIRLQTRFRDVIEAGIYAHYPEAEISEIEDYATKFPNEFPNDEYEMWGGEHVLDKHEMFPIRTYVDFEDRMSQEIKDPLGQVLEQLAKMRAGEHFWIQMLVQPSSGSWAEAGVKYVRKIYGDEDKPKKSAFLEAAESIVSWPMGILEHATGIDLSGLFGMDNNNEEEEDQWRVFKITLPQKEEAEAVLRKSSKVGHGVKIRTLYIAKKNAFVKVERTGIVKGVLSVYANLNLNRFTLYIPQVPKDDYFWMRWVYTRKQHRLMKAYQGRSFGIGATPFFLNVEELASLWHFPAIPIKAPLIKKSESKRAEPPSGLPITFLEETLPGIESQTDELGFKNERSDENTREDFSSNITFAPVEEEPLPEALPTPQAPTEPQAEVDDDQVPKNLPI